jgi:hypothetical protein
MDRCETANSPPQRRFPRMSIRLTAVNRMAATGSSISIAQATEIETRMTRPEPCGWSRRVFPHPFPRWEVVREGFSILSPDQPPPPSELASRPPTLRKLCVGGREVKGRRLIRTTLRHAGWKGRISRWSKTSKLRDEVGVLDMRWIRLTVWIILHVSKRAYLKLGYGEQYFLWLSM